MKPMKHYLYPYHKCVSREACVRSADMPTDEELHIHGRESIYCPSCLHCLSPVKREHDVELTSFRIRLDLLKSKIKTDLVVDFLKGEADPTAAELDEADSVRLHIYSYQKKNAEIDKFGLRKLKEYVTGMVVVSDIKFSNLNFQIVTTSEFEERQVSRQISDWGLDYTPEFTPLYSLLSCISRNGTPPDDCPCGCLSYKQ